MLVGLHFSYSEEGTQVACQLEQTIAHSHQKMVGHLLIPNSQQNAHCQRYLAIEGMATNLSLFPSHYKTKHKFVMRSRLNEGVSQLGWKEGQQWKDMQIKNEFEQGSMTRVS